MNFYDVNEVINSNTCHALSQIASGQDKNESTKELDNNILGETGAQEPPAAPRQQEEVWSPGKAYEARLREVEERFRDVEDKYKGYEVLLDDGSTATDRGVGIPKG